MAAPVAGESASPRTSGSTVSRVSAQGRADNCASSNVLPAGLPSSAGSAPRNARTRAIDGRSVAPKTATSRSAPEAARVQSHGVAADAPPRELEHHPPAHRLTGGRDPVQALLADEVRDGVGQGGDRDLAGQRRRLAEPRKVDGDHLTALGQLVEDRRPRSPPGTQTVDEQQRAAAPSSYVVQRHTGEVPRPGSSHSARRPCSRPNKGAVLGRSPRSTAEAVEPLRPAGSSDRKHEQPGAGGGADDLAGRSFADLDGSTHRPGAQGDPYGTVRHVNRLRPPSQAREPYW